VTGLGAIFGPEVVAAIERLVDDRVAVALAEQAATGAPPLSRYLTVTEAADYLRCSRQRVDDLLSSRRLTRVKDGSRTLLLREEIDAYLVRQPGRSA
jgi:excisionase family DNA binding protein